MSNSRIFIVMTLIIGMVTVFAGCYKVTTVDLSSGSVLNRTVTFSGDVLPIFQRSCALSGCHAPGGQVPDLSPDRAYGSLLQEDLINFDDPANSELYDWLSGKIQPAMPLGGSDPDINAVMLTWLTQGAQNN